VKTGKPIKVLIAHPYTLVREGLCHIVRMGGHSICYQVDNMVDLVKNAADQNPDIVVVDFRLSKDRYALINELKKSISGVVAIVAVPEEIAEAPEALKAGAIGYLSYSQTSEEFLQSLSLLSKGTVIVSHDAGGHVQNSIRKKYGGKDELTDREKEVVVLVAQGATNREIARKLIISEHTIKIHLHGILNKLNLRNRQQIAAYAIQYKLLNNIHGEDYE